MFYRCTSSLLGMVTGATGWPTLAQISTDFRNKNSLKIWNTGFKRENKVTLWSVNWNPVAFEFLYFFYFKENIHHKPFYHSVKQLEGPFFIWCWTFLFSVEKMQNLERMMLHWAQAARSFITEIVFNDLKTRAVNARNFGIGRFVKVALIDLQTNSPGLFEHILCNCIQVL